LLTGSELSLTIPAAQQQGDGRKTKTETTPAPTSAAALAGIITPSWRPIAASAISRGMVVAVMKVISSRCRNGSTRA